MNPTPEHSKISPTAKLVAYWRQFSDIPYAREVANLVRAEEVFKGFFKSKDPSIENMSWFGPLIEARYKSMVRAIQRQKITQVLELASGMSLRGLAMTSDPEIIYVETDLPGMSSEKKAVVDQIRKQKNIPERKNLFFKEVNVINRDELENAVLPFFKEKPIAIIHEGLFQYLSLEEKRVAAQNIHSLLSRFGGVWMTPDLNTKDDLSEWRQTRTTEELTEGIRTATQRDFNEHAFKNDAHIQSFFSDLGFEVSEFPQIDSSFELTSAKRLNVSPENLSTYVEKLKIWSLKVRTSMTH